MATYPAAVKSFTSKVDGVDYFYASDLNVAYDEITAVQSTLGVGASVSLSSTTGTFNAGTNVDYGTVNNRLNNLELGVINGATHAVQTTGGSLIQPTAISVVPLTIKGFTGSSSDLFAVLDSTGSPKVRVDSTGLLTASAGISITPINTTITPLFVKGIASQSGDYIGVVDSTNAYKLRLLNNGDVNLYGSTFIAPIRDAVPLGLQAVAGQTQDLFRVTDSLSNTLMKVDKSGAITSQGNLHPFKMACGAGTITTTASTNSSTTVTLPAGFTVAPIVQLTVVNSSGDVLIQATSVTTTTITVTVWADQLTGANNFAAGGTIGFHWMAIQGTSSAAAL